jgi:pimeloyl-ACP methyl ester carboxylesterase
MGESKLTGSGLRSRLALSTDGVLLADGEAATWAHFFGPKGRRLFGALHLPGNAPELGVVVCQPVHAETARNYRREVLLAKSLAGRGAAVLRFHYRGAGNSDGESTELDLQTMMEDTARATLHIQELAGVQRLAFVGTRLGATAAAVAAAAHPGSFLALWDPVVEPHRYFRELFRARMMIDLKRGGTGGSSTEQFIDRLEQEGLVEVAGYPITDRLYRSALQCPLPPPVGSEAGPVMIVELNAQERLRKETVALTDAWRAAGATVETRAIAHTESWWFGASGRGGTLDARTVAQDIVPATADFLSRRTRGRVA